MSDPALRSHDHAVVADYDSPWKTVLERYFPDFLAFFFPSALETAGSPTDRYQAKLELIRSLYRRGFARQDILELFRFIDWVLTLPEGLEQQLRSEDQQFDEEKHMHYLSSIERMAQQNGIEQGIGQGQANLLHAQVRQRFGPVPPEIEARIRGARPDQLDQWALQILDARCLEDVFVATGEH